MVEAALHTDAADMDAFHLALSWGRPTGPQRPDEDHKKAPEGQEPEARLGAPEGAKYAFGKASKRPPRAKSRRCD